MLLFSPYLNQFNPLTSIYRSMTHTERRQLQKLIQKLPKENLVRVVEIIQHGRPVGKPCGEEIFVDLEKEVKK